MLTQPARCNVSYLRTMPTPSEPKRPVVLSYAPVRRKSKPVEPGRLLVPLAVLLLITSIGAALGSLLNVVNFEISSTYFTWVMDWPRAGSLTNCCKDGAWAGVWEGGGVGLLFGSIVGTPPWTRSQLRDLRPYIISIALVALLAWATGGITGAAMAARNPNAFFNNSYRPAIRHKSDFIRFGWVYGSTVSLEFGGGFGACVVPIVFCAKWQRRELEAHHRKREFKAKSA
jgi:hypothetical protein